MTFVMQLIGSLFVLIFTCAGWTSDLSADDCLAVDIGATNSRYVMLPTKLPNESLREASCRIISCPSIRPLCTENVMAILPNECKPKRVAIGLPCPCENGVPTEEKLTDLKKQVQDRYGETCCVILSNDAINWMKGALVYQNLSKDNADNRNALIFVLGTAVGLAYFDGKEVTPLELANFTFDYKKTRKLLNIDEKVIIGKWTQYLLVGRYFWEEVSPNALYDAISLLKSKGDNATQFCAVVKAFASDVVSTLEKDRRIDKVIFAGGNACYLNEEFYDLHDTAVLNSKTLNMSSEIIPMLSVYYGSLEEI